MVALTNLVIASLGSSFAAGPGIDPIIEPLAAYRSGNNYAHLLTAKLPGAILYDQSVSSATLSNILDTPQTVNGTATFNTTIFPPQLSGLPANADLVLVLGGGNDIGYIGGLSRQSNSSFTVDGLGTKYRGVLDAIHAKACNAHVILVTYLTVLGGDVVPVPDPNANVVFNATRVAYYQDVAERLRQATLKAVEGREQWAEVLDVVGPSWRHGLGAEVPWMGGANAAVPYHPFVNGHAAVADMLFERLKSGMFRKKTDKGWTARL